MFIFNKSGESGEIIKDGKKADVVPILKKGKWDGQNNYKPVGLKGSKHMATTQLFLRIIAGVQSQNPVKALTSPTNQHFKKLPYHH